MTRVLRLRSRAVLAWLTALIIAAAAAVDAQTIRRAPAFANGDLVPPPVDGWPTNGGDWGNRRYSPLTDIDRNNVKDLKGVWRTHLRGSGVGPQYSGEAQPIVYRGVMYVVTGANDVFALDVDEGEILWEYRANLDPANNAVCCGWTSRGVGLGDGKVFVGQLDGKLVALDQRTGAVVWSTQAERWQEGYTITSAPLYYDGLVVTGFAGGERGIRGRVKAFNALDGSLAWTFYTVPGPGEVGHDTWPQDNEIWMDGGAPLWNTPAVDPELGLLYFATGNPGPDYNGSVRTGDNLFSTSIVAIEARTGEYRWHFQQVHHDIWDYDAASPVVLFDVEIGGEVRKAVAEASKTGWVYILDRTTGEPLLGIDERPVPQEPRQATAATQPYPRGDAFIPQYIAIAPEGTTLVNQGRIFTPFWTTPTLMKPGPPGGANWAPTSYDVQSGYLFVCAADRIWSYLSQEVTDERPAEGASYIAGGIGGFHLRNLGVFAALDMRTNELVWQQHWGEPCYSGSVATAGGLVFVGRNDGRLTALDSSDGTKLWEFQTGAGMNAPASVFEHRGRQYVAAYSAGNLFAGSTRGDSVWLFSLDGTLDPVLPGGAQLTSAPGEASGQPNADNGKTVYDRACTFCHGEQGEGGHGGGPSLQALRNGAVVMQVASEGRNAMPAFGGTLTAEEIRNVAAYVSERLAR
jgi:quinohemoprotein ethanol dehydrogenase